MPEINLTTNVKVENPKALVLELSKLGAELISPAVQPIQARYTYNENQSFVGLFDPAFSLDFKVIQVTPETSIKYSKAFSEFLSEKLGVSNDRGFIMCIDPGREYVGFMGTTVEVIRKSKEAKGL